MKNMRIFLIINTNYKFSAFLICYCIILCYAVFSLDLIGKFVCLFDFYNIYTCFLGYQKSEKI